MKEKYVLLEWPECQEFMSEEDCYWAADGMILFVPEKLYESKR